MKKLISGIFFILSASVFSQSDLAFDKGFIQSENKWIVMPADSSNTYMFGLVYIDTQAGLTFHYGGSFKVDDKKHYIVDRDETTSVNFKQRIGIGNGLKIAFIPESRFEELKITSTPDWLKIYQGGDPVRRLYGQGYTYNAWGACEKALEFLEKAYQTNPDYDGLATELAFSYNCLQQYPKAIVVLEKALKKEPLDAYTNKELIYALAKSGALEKAEKACRKVLKDCPDKTYNTENIYSVLHGYFLKKDTANFAKWLKEHQTQLAENKDYMVYVDGMKKELKL